MAFARRRFFRGSPSRFGRRKRQGAWTGSYATLTLTQNVASSVYLWSDLDSQRLNMAGKGVHQRTLLWIGWWPGDIGLHAHFAYSMSVYKTDASGNVPSASIVRPWFDAMSLLERDPIDYGYRIVTFGASATPFEGASLQRDVKVKRRMDDTDALLLTMEWSPVTGTTSLTQRVSIVARTYVSW